MGNYKRHFKGNNKSADRQQRRDREADWKKSTGGSRESYVTIPENVRMEAFYKSQAFIDENEWKDFMEHLRLPLPACFRIHSDYEFAHVLKKQLLTYVGESIDNNGVLIQPVKQLCWYPNGVGYQLGTDRRSIRKLPVLKELHQWMIEHTNSGNITRQEAVSMVPPLALNVLVSSVDYYCCYAFRSPLLILPIDPGVMYLYSTFHLLNFSFFYLPCFSFS